MSNLYSVSVRGLLFFTIIFYNHEVMKQGIHPNYHTNAGVVCSTCGTKYEYGSTKDQMTIAICAHCHPFYTGEQSTVLDLANKVKTYESRAKAAEELKKRKAEIAADKAKRESERVRVVSTGKEGVKSLADLLKEKSKKK